MIGGELAECHLSPREAKEVRLDVDQLTLASPDPFGTSLKDISMQVRSGEILGIAGVSGNGQKEFLAALSGERLERRRDDQTCSDRRWAMTPTRPCRCALKADIDFVARGGRLDAAPCRR